MEDTIISKIPLRKSMKGAQVGKAVIESFVYDYLHQKEKGYSPLYSAEELLRMVNSLPNQYERRIYAEYIGLYNGILGEFNRAQGAYQQAQNGYYLLKTTLEGVQQDLLAREWLVDFVADYGIATETPSFIKREGEFLTLFIGLPVLYSNDASRLELLQAREDFLYPAQRILHAYNALLEIIAIAFSLPHLLYLQVDTGTLFHQIKEFNRMREHVNSLLANADLLAMLEVVFPPLDPFTGHTSSAAEKSVQEKLKSPQSYEGGSLLRLMEELMKG